MYVFFNKLKTGFSIRFELKKRFLFYQKLTLQRSKLNFFIFAILFHTKNFQQVECHRVLKLTPYITGTQKCFALHRPIDYQSLERIRYKRSRPLVISLNRTQFQQRRAWKVSIALHTLQHPLHYNDLIWLTLRPDRYTSNELTYNIEITQHLQFWIKHRCKNYTAEPFQSRANCYNVCFARHCRQINNGKHELYWQLLLQNLTNECFFLKQLGLVKYQDLWTTS